MKEAEEFVDAFIAEHGEPPSYRQVMTHFNLKSAGAAHHRLRRYRDKMKQSLGVGKSKPDCAMCQQKNEIIIKLMADVKRLEG